MRNAYIISGLRSPIGKAKKGSFRFTRSDDLAAQVIQKLIKKTKGLDPKQVDDLIVGNAVPEAEQGMQMARYISLLSLPKEVPGFIVNRYCGSGLEAIHLAISKIKSGYADCIIAGEPESMSMVPFLGYKSSPNYNLSKKSPDYYLNMGLTAEKLAKKYNISREDSDLFSYNSHMKALRAIKDKKFEEEIVPINVEETIIVDSKKTTRKKTITVDEGPRIETTLEALSKLKPVFKFGGQVTAGNSSQMSDGSAFVVVVSEKIYEENKPESISKNGIIFSNWSRTKYYGNRPSKSNTKSFNYGGFKKLTILIKLS